ncbi:MAG TPA: hypothetical protein VIN73_07760 [Vicingaceae bacterium]
MNFYRIVLYIISFVLLTSCWDNDPKDLFDKGKDELLNNEKEYSYLIDVLENISKATDNSDAYLFIQTKQNNIIYSDSNGIPENPPIIYPDNFIIIANKLGVDGVILTPQYYRLGIADNNSTRYSTHLFYQRVDTFLIGEGIVYHERINDKWLVGLKKMPMVIEWLGI